MNLGKHEPWMRKCHTNNFAEQGDQRGKKRSFRNAANICVRVRTCFLIRYLNGATQYSSPCRRWHCKPRTERRRSRWRWPRRSSIAPPALAWICHTTSISASPGSTPWPWTAPFFQAPALKPQQTVEGGARQAAKFRKQRGTARAAHPHWLLPCKYRTPWPLRRSPARTPL